MSIRLLATYDGFSPGDIITLDSALETALITGGNASATLTGGVVAYRERQPVMIQPATKRRGSVSLIANRKATVPLTEGSALTITPTAGTTGTYQRYDAAGAAVGAMAPISTGVLTVGPFEGGYTVEIKCATGSLAAKVADSVLGDRFSKRPKSNVLSFALGGYLDVPIAVVTNPYSLMAQVVLEAPFDTMRIGVLNADAAAIAGVKVSLSAGSTLGSGTGTLGLAGTGQPIDAPLGFQPATFGGAGSGTLTAAPAVSSGATGANIGGSNCSITWTDWMLNPSVARVDGATGLPCANIIVTWPAGVNRTRMAMNGSTAWNDEATTSGRPFRVMASSTKDAVANPAWMLVSNGQCARTYTDFPPIVIQYTLRNGYGETLVVYGDSIQEGSGADTPKFGWPREFQALISTPARPVSICNLAVAGSGMANWERRVAATIGAFSQASVFFPSLTPNSLSAPIVAGDITLARKYFGQIMQQLDKSGLLVFTSTVMPTNYAIKPYGPSDITYRVAWNNEKRAGNFLLADFDLAQAGPLDVNGQYTLLDTADGIHPNTTGYKKDAAVFLPLWVAA